MSQIHLRVSRTARITYALGSRVAKMLLAAALVVALAGGVVWQWQPIWVWALDVTGLESAQTVRKREAHILAHTELKASVARAESVTEPESPSEELAARWESFTQQLEIARTLLESDTASTYELRFANVRLRRAQKAFDAAFAAQQAAEAEAAQRAKEAAEAALAAAQAAAEQGDSGGGGDWSGGGSSSGGGDWSSGGGSSGGGGGSYAVESTAYSTIECAIYPSQVTITAYASGTVTLNAGGSANSGSGSTSLTITAYGPVSASATGVSPSLGWGLC